MQLFPRRWAWATMLALIAIPLAQAASTARVALKEVNAAAQKWQPDAVLTHVSTLSAKADGKANSWLYNFYSVKARKSAIVTARDIRVEIEPDVRTTSVDPIGEFIDSDKALEAARKHGLMGKATSQPRMLWSISVMGESILSWSIDSKDGSLLHKGDVKLK